MALTEPYGGVVALLFDKCRGELFNLVIYSGFTVALQ
jgi:hypothetical protein